jgi:chromosome segregation ATPase
MDANELAMIAYDVMPGGIMTETGKGEMFGVLKMALRTLASHYEALLVAAGENNSAAYMLVVEAQAQRDAARQQYDSLKETYDGVFDERGKLTADRDGWKSEAGELQRRIDRLNAENARLHRSMEQWMSAAQHAQALPPGAVKVPPGTEEL